VHALVYVCVCVCVNMSMPEGSYDQSGSTPPQPSPQPVADVTLYGVAAPPAAGVTALLLPHARRPPSAPSPERSAVPQPPPLTASQTAVQRAM
jgi:hypothetical protein